MTEDVLLPLRDRAVAGDAEATQALLAKVAPALLAVVRAVLGRQSADVEDVLQESLVAVVNALPGFRGESSVLHFARTIALRRALQQRRTRVRRGPEVLLDESLVDGGDSPARVSMATRRREIVRRLIEELPEDQAETLAQRVVLGYTAEEVAEQNRVPLGTVKSRLRLAKAALKARIENDPTLLELLEADDDDAR